jgi:thiamine transport system substrate-binding protein
MKKVTLLSIFCILLSACASQATPVNNTEPQTLTVMTHDSFAVSEDVVKAFEEAKNAKIVFLQSGDAGAVLNKAILTKEAPLADVLYGVDNTFLSRAITSEIFESYASPELANIPDAFKLDSSNNALPVDYGDVCINYDKKYFADNSLAVPQSLEDLTKPEYANLLVVENPATSSTGLAFMLATVAHFGEGYIDYWTDLKANGVVVVDGWETAYYTNFSGSTGSRYRRPRGRRRSSSIPERTPSRPKHRGTRCSSKRSR